MMQGPASHTRAQLVALVALRFLIGWHFLYEGFAKAVNPFWTSAGYLAESQGPLADFFVWLVASPARLAVVDAINVWGLMLIGLALLLGVGTRLASLFGIFLLALYYLANPPLPGLESSIPTEGSYVIVNKTLIELAAMVVLLLFPTDHQVGLRAWFTRKG